MSESVGLAVIGCGDVATTRHLPAIGATTGVHLVACCDRDVSRTETAAGAGGAAYATTDIERVLADPAVDAVIVATPPWVTPEITIAALRAGKQVLCEKPMALTIEEALAVQAAERETGRFVQVGFVLRHGPLFSALRRWIAEGKLGGPLDFRISVFDETWDPEGDPEHYARIMATLEHGAPCVHDGAHTMDHLNFLLDGAAPVGLTAWGRKTRPEFPRPNLNGAVIDFEGGHRARVEIGWFLPEFPPPEWTIIGPEGIAWFDQANRRAVLRSTTTNAEVGLEKDWFVSCFLHQLAVFRDAVRSGIAAKPGTAEGIASLALTQRFEHAMIASDTVGTRTI